MHRKVIENSFFEIRSRKKKSTVGFKKVEILGTLFIHGELQQIYFPQYSGLCLFKYSEYFNNARDSAGEHFL